MSATKLVYRTDSLLSNKYILISRPNRERHDITCATKKKEMTVKIYIYIYIFHFNYKIHAENSGLISILFSTLLSRVQK